MGDRGRGRGHYARVEASGRPSNGSFRGKSHLKTPGHRVAKESARMDGLRAHRKPKKAVMLELPSDIVTQTVLPFLTWHDMCAMACACRHWSLVVQSAREMAFEWRTVEASGMTPRDCLDKLIKRMAPGHASSKRDRKKTRTLGVEAETAVALRFPPSLMLVTLSFANAREMRQAGVFWTELVTTLEQERVLPVGCRLVGLLSETMVSRSEDGAVNCSISLSMGYFPSTSIEVASFERKELRWSASGQTEEIECPFKKTDDDGVSSFILLSSNPKSAEALLSLTNQWYPSASAVMGGVVARVSQAPPLMTYCREYPKPKISRDRRHNRPSRNAPRVQINLPSTALLHLRGRVGMQSFALSSDQRITGILRCESLNGTSVPQRHDEEEGHFDIPVSAWLDHQSYGDVSIIGGSDSESNSLANIVRTALSEANHLIDNVNAVFLFAAENPEDLSCESLTCQRQVRRILLFVVGEDVVSVEQHWKVGEYGVIGVCNDSSFDHRTHLSQLQEDMRRKSMMPFGSILMGTQVPITKIVSSNGSAVALSGARHHISCVDSVIGPVALPAQESLYQGTTLRQDDPALCGALFYHI